VQLHGGTNLGGAENYVALDATGAGQMIGLVLEINNVAGGWYGEGEAWPPAIHGTGTEEIFGGGACPTREFAGPYHCFHLVESPDWAGLVGAYRWFMHDPLRFTRTLRPPLRPVYGEARQAFLGAVGEAVRVFSAPAIHRLAALGESFYAGRFEETLRRLREG
jgi:hypothetical protein